EKRQRRLKRQALPDVILHMMTKFVSHDHFNLFTGKILKQRIGNDNSSCIAPTNDSGIRLPGLFAQGPLKNSAHRGVRTPRETIDSVLQILILNRSEFEKQRQE